MNRGLMKYLIILFIFSSSFAIAQEYFKNLKSFNVVPNYEKRIKDSSKNQNTNIRKYSTGRRVRKIPRSTAMKKKSFLTITPKKLPKKSIKNYKIPKRIDVSKRIPTPPPYINNNVFNIQTNEEIEGTNDILLLDSTRRAQDILTSKMCITCHAEHEGSEYGSNWNEMWNNTRNWAVIGNNRYSQITPNRKLINLQNPSNSYLLKISRGCSDEARMPDPESFPGAEYELTQGECNTLRTWIRRLARVHGTDAGVEKCISQVENSVNYETTSSLQASRGSYINVSCKEGYVGGGRLRCGSDFQFSPTGLCRPKSCFLEIPNGDSLSSYFSAEGGTTIQCDEGYLPSSTTPLHCGPDGTFTTAANVNIACNPIRCEYQVPNGNILSANYNENAQINCMSGYQLTGNNQSTQCQSDGRFSVQTQSNICEGVRCEAELTNGNTSSISHRYDSNPSIATYRVTCPNSKTPSIPEVRCNQNGEFINPTTSEVVNQVICENSCQIPEIAHSNFPEAQSIISGSSITVDCNLGYEGSQSYQCINGAILSNNLPISNFLRCTPQACEEKSFQYSDTIARGVTGDVVRITCNNGRVETTTCRAPNSQNMTGQFDNISCSSDQCSLPPIENSNIISSQVINTNQQIEVLCNNGYSLYKGPQPSEENSVSLNCLESGSFDEMNISCRANNCTPIDFDNSTLGENHELTAVTNQSINFTCLQGYEDKATGELQGTVTCQENGQFSDDRCVPKNCTPSRIVNSKLYQEEGSLTGRTGERIDVICDGDFIGGGEIICQADGTFTHAQCDYINLDSEINSLAMIESNFMEEIQEEKDPLKSPILAGRFYLYNLLSNIYDLENILSSNTYENGEYDDDGEAVVITDQTTVKKILESNILLNYVALGDSCDASEQYFPSIDSSYLDFSQEFLFYEDLPPFRKCVDAEFFSKMRTPASTLREGWRISTCKDININFDESKKPLSLIFEHFNNLEINNESLKYAYHLFNPFHEISQNGLKSFHPFYNNIPDDSYLNNQSTNPIIFELANSLPQTEKWEYIFNTLCIDPSMELLTR